VRIGVKLSRCKSIGGETASTKGGSEIAGRGVGGGVACGSEEMKLEGDVVLDEDVGRSREFWGQGWVSRSVFGSGLARGGSARLTISRKTTRMTLSLAKQGPAAAGQIGTGAGWGGGGGGVGGGVVRIHQRKSRAGHLGVG